MILTILIGGGNGHDSFYHRKHLRFVLYGNSFQKNTAIKILKNMIGLSIGNYKILEKLNGNEIIGVYKAFDVPLNRDVFIKIPGREFLNQSGVRESFRQEAATLAQLNHPSIPTLHLLTAVDNQLFMVLEYFDGEGLDRVLQRKENLNYREAVSIFTQLLDCLEYANGIGIAHGNLKTGKIFLTETGSIKILGFGDSEHLQITESGKNILFENLSENAENKISDIYAVGKILYETLTGESFIIGQIEETKRHLSAVNPVIPVVIIDAVIKALRLNSSEKFQTAAEFREALLKTDSDISDIKTNSVIDVKSDFASFPERKSVAICSVDFSPDKNKIAENVFIKNPMKTGEIGKSGVQTSFLWKPGQRRYTVASATIFAIIFFHFIFQFFFIQSKKVRMAEDLTKTGQFEETGKFTEQITEKIVEPETNDEVKIELETNDEAKAKTKANVETKSETKKSDTRANPQTSPPRVQPPPKTAPSRTVIKKKEPPESRAERLRRAEKILTGV